jgi:hypothetical protein
MIIDSDQHACVIHHPAGRFPGTAEVEAGTDVVEAGTDVVVNLYEWPSSASGMFSPTRAVVGPASGNAPLQEAGPSTDRLARARSPSVETSRAST